MRWPLLLLIVTGCTCPGNPVPDAGPNNDAGLEAGKLSFTLEAFHSVLRGDSVERTVTFTNTTREDVTLRNIAIGGPAFTLVGPATLLVPALDQATLKVRFAPTVFGPNEGTLVFETPLSQALPLLGEGVGPALTLDAGEIDLGTLALYDGFPTRASAELLVRNDGFSATVAPRPDTALQIIFDVQSTSTALASELCVGDCSSPLHVEANRQTTLPVTLTTTSAGLKTWDVRVLSNDPDAPLRTVPVTANVVSRPTCQFSVPSQLNFGGLTGPEQRELELVFENVGAEVCEVRALELDDEGLYSVVNAPASPQSVAPGELLRVLVRAAAPAPPPLVPYDVTGEIRFELNHPDQFARVPLEARLGSGCLIITPSPVDFAMVQTGCRSVERTVTVRNRCPTAEVLTAISLPAFSSFSMSAQLPLTVPGNGSVTFTARYTPVTLGPAREVISIVQGSFLTTLSVLGEGTASGLNTDRFPPRGMQLDLLIALADSSGMADKQARLRAQLPGLITTLQNLNVDFRIGVITAAPTSGGLRSTSGSLKWLTPATPALLARLEELTAFTGNEGTAAACEVPVLRALTPPWSTDPFLNGGFVRPGAVLSVLCITDTSEVVTRVSELLRVKPAGEMLVDVIGPVAASTPQCSTAWVSAMPGLAAYPERTGGQLVDVCSADFVPLFSAIAARSVERTFFALRSSPDLASAVPMELRVNGAPLSSLAWSYSGPGNSVRLPVNAGVSNSDAVEISYPVPCAP